jgi:hypothetical protein
MGVDAAGSPVLVASVVMEAVVLPVSRVTPGCVAACGSSVTPGDVVVVEDDVEVEVAPDGAELLGDVPGDGAATVGGTVVTWWVGVSPTTDTGPVSGEGCSAGGTAVAIGISVGSALTGGTGAVVAGGSAGSCCITPPGCGVETPEPVSALTVPPPRSIRSVAMIRQRMISTPETPRKITAPSIAACRDLVSAGEMNRR